jgi:hypothetical protein
MAHIPQVVEGTNAEATWRQIETLGKQQGLDPSKTEIALANPDPRFKSAIDALASIDGAEIKGRNEFNALVVRLAYEGEGGTSVIRDRTAVVIAKISTHQA